LTSNHAGRLPLALALAAAGIGFGLFQTLNNRTMLTTAAQRRSAVAAGMLATMRLVGQTTGAVIVASILRPEGTTSPAPLLEAAALSLAAVALGFFNARTAASNAK
jgi:DHA2 family multidrug resistance protein-like MFS transporter